MKKISAVLAAMVMLVMCTSSLGNYFLVDNVSITVKGADDSTGAATTVPLKGYLIITISDSDTIVDANLILYGKDSSPAKQKVYVQLNANYSSGGGTLGIDVWAIGNFLFMNLQGSEPFDFEILLSGKMTLKDVGVAAGGKKMIASSLKGVAIVWEGFLLGPSGQDVSATGNASAPLNNSLTKAFNDTEPTWTQNQVLNGQMIEGVLHGIRPDLERKGYVDMTP